MGWGFFDVTDFIPFVGTTLRYGQAAVLGIAGQGDAAADAALKGTMNLGVDAITVVTLGTGTAEATVAKLAVKEGVELTAEAVGKGLVEKGVEEVALKTGEETVEHVTVNGLENVVAEEELKSISKVTATRQAIGALPKATKIAIVAAGGATVVGSEAGQVALEVERKRKEREQQEAEMRRVEAEQRAEHHQLLSEQASTLIQAYQSLDEQNRINTLINQYYRDDDKARRHAAQLQAEANFTFLLNNAANDEAERMARMRAERAREEAEIERVQRRTDALTDVAVREIGYEARRAQLGAPPTFDRLQETVLIVGDDAWRQQVLLTGGLLVALLVLSEVYL